MEEAGDGRGQGLLRQEGEKVHPGAAAGPAHLQTEGRASQGQRSHLFFLLWFSLNMMGFTFLEGTYHLVNGSEKYRFPHKS